MKLTSLIKENIDIGDILYSNRDQIELDFGPRTFKTLQSSLMMDDEAYVRNSLTKKGYMSKEKMPFEEQAINKIKEYVRENLRNWFKKEKWKRIDTQGNIAGDCGTMPKGKKTQRCLPAAKARSLTKKQRAATSRKKTKSNKQFVSNTKAAKVKLKK